ncbi:MAG: hypothetical protein ACXWDT_05820, partial [Solirubrobacterales bacterium]
LLDDVSPPPQPQSAVSEAASAAAARPRSRMRRNIGASAASGNADPLLASEGQAWQGRREPEWQRHFGD